ncbi:VOC family protein [Actinomadura chokoriensis]|uniref:VOC family protein n=1 Tax=Actinomadura chokoriensis TaxID=454156 RepID=A0ABV4QYC1_9ACTN
MNMVRQVIVFDAADLHAESAFWAGVLGGHVLEDAEWHSVIDAAGEWRIGVQLAPNHVPPGWPHGIPQQVHLDLHVDDPRAAHDEVMALGARLLQAAADFDADEGHQVYADPAGHPFCVGWGHPSQEALAAFVTSRLGQ